MQEFLRMNDRPVVQVARFVELCNHQQVLLKWIDAVVHKKELFKHDSEGQLELPFERKDREKNFWETPFRKDL